MHLRGHISSSVTCTTVALAGLVVGLAACQEPPSYRLRWAIEGRPMIDTAACSESGLLQVRARAFVAPGEWVAERVLPCFPAAFRDPDGMADGSVLAPGRYAIELRGIDRTAGVWDEDVPSFDPTAPSHDGCSPDTIECAPGELVCACESLVVEDEGSTVDLPELVLVAPPECVDGIDNDRDGLVDGSDPSCNVDFGDGTEGVPVGVTELRLTLGLLGGNPVASCSAVPLRRLQLAYVGEQGDEVVFEAPCFTDQPYLTSLVLPAGRTTFSVLGLDLTGEPVTERKSFEAQIEPTGGTVVQAIDFGPDDFLEPIVSAIRVRPGYIGERGTEAQERYSCGPPAVGSELTRGLLQLDTLRVELLTGHAGPLGAPVALEDGTVLDGPTTIDCRTSLDTEPLVWGSYRLVLEALSSEGEACFSNADDPAFVPPGEIGTVFLPRVYQDDGTVPSSCHDCETDGDCGLDVLRCVDNVCQSLCATDDDCRSEHVDDDAFACIDGACARAGG